MKAWTKVKYIEDFTLYPKPDQSSPGTPVTGNPMGEITVGSAGFTEARLADGRHGYVLGTVRVMKIVQMQLSQPETSLFKTASKGAPVVAIAKKGTILTRDGGQEVVKEDNVTWIPVTSPEGHFGYMLGDTKVKVLNPRLQVQPSDGMKNILIGAAICLIGIVITWGTYQAASSNSGGGTYFVAWGAMLFGGIRILKGVMQAMGAQWK